MGMTPRTGDIEDRMKKARAIARCSEPLLLLVKHGHEDASKAIVEWLTRDLWDCGTSIGWRDVYDAMLKEAGGALGQKHWNAGVCPQAVNVASDYEREVEKLTEDLRLLQEIHLHGCECSSDEACHFARQRDKAKNKIERALKMGGFRWSEWGDRAVSVCEILEGLETTEDDK